MLLRCFSRALINFKYETMIIEIGWLTENVSISIATFVYSNLSRFKTLVHFKLITIKNYTQAFRFSLPQLTFFIIRGGVTSLKHFQTYVIKWEYCSCLEINEEINLLAQYLCALNFHLICEFSWNWCEFIEQLDTSFSFHFQPPP